MKKRERWVYASVVAAFVAAMSLMPSSYQDPGIPADKIVSVEKRIRVAFHEAGHAVANVAFKGPANIEQIDVLVDGRLAEGTLGKTIFRNVDVGTRPEMLQAASYLLAGQAANTLFTGGATNGASDDIAIANKLVWRMHTQYGMGRTLLLYLDWESAPPHVQADAERDLKDAFLCADLILRANIVMVQELAERLLQAPIVKGRHLLTHLQVVAFFKDRPLRPPESVFEETPDFCRTLRP